MILQGLRNFRGFVSLYLSSIYLFFLKKVKINLAVLNKAITFAASNRIGSLAQLVQSICLTSRGSGVRTPQLPLKKSTYENFVSAFLFYGNMLGTRKE